MRIAAQRHTALDGKGQNPSPWRRCTQTQPFANSLKPSHNNIPSWRGGKLFFGAGWLLAIVLSFWAAPRIYHRLLAQWPGYQKVQWEQKMTAKKHALAARWQDPRPLILFAGDSQIEYGNWYDLLAGAWAVRNGGLAAAKIADVTELVLAIGDPHAETVVLLCGGNNLSRHDRRDACLRDYEALLAAVRQHLQPESILVLSVLPVRGSAAGQAAQQFNASAAQFNTELAACCQRHQVQFLDATSAVSGENGELAAELTVDGLHLNAEGYRRLARVVAQKLAQIRRVA